MSKHTPKPMKDLPAADAESVRGGADGLRLLAQVNHMVSQDASSSVKQVASSQKKAIK